MMQLPGINEEEVKLYRKAMKEHQIQDGKIETFCRLESEKKVAVALNLFYGDKAKFSQLEMVSKCMPVISVSSKVHVKGEEDITANDVISFEVTIQYDLLPENTGPGFVCSQTYPFLKKESWFFIIVDGKSQEIMSVERVQTSNDSNKVNYEFQHQFGKQGHFPIHAYVMNDSYIGFDKDVDISVSVEKARPFVGLDD